MNEQWLVQAVLSLFSIFLTLKLTLPAYVIFWWPEQCTQCTGGRREEQTGGWFIQMKQPIAVLYSPLYTPLACCANVHAVHPPKTHHSALVIALALHTSTYHDKPRYVIDVIIYNLLFCQSIFTWCLITKNKNFDLKGSRISDSDLLHLAHLSHTHIYGRDRDMLRHAVLLLLTSNN